MPDGSIPKLPFFFLYLLLWLKNHLTKPRVKEKDMATSRIVMTKMEETWAMAANIILAEARDSIGLTNGFVTADLKLCDTIFSLSILSPLKDLLR